MHNLSLQMSRALSSTAQVDAELNTWLAQCVGRKMAPDDIVAAMVKTGRNPDFCAMLVRLAFDNLFLNANGDERIRQRSAQGTPDVPHAVQHFSDGGDRQVRVLMTLGSLRVNLFESFLSDEECEHLKGCVDGRLRRSRVVGKEFQDTESQVRTSQGAFIDVGATPMVSAIEARIAKVTGIPADHGECLQVLHYRNTEEYQPHFDFFEPQNDNEMRMLAEPGNRVSTLIFYLSDVEEGGATYFPQLDLAIHPKKGSCLMFSYLDADGTLDMRSEHAGLPVTRGDKWIATKWLRERVIRQPPVEQWSTSDEGNMGPGMATTEDVASPAMATATILPFAAPSPPAALA